jgi:hypothetical protein
MRNNAFVTYVPFSTPFDHNCRSFWDQTNQEDFHHLAKNESKSKIRNPFKKNFKNYFSKNLKFIIQVFFKFDSVDYELKGWS